MNSNHPQFTNHGERHENNYNRNKRTYFDSTNSFASGVNYPLGSSNYNYPIYYPTNATDYTITSTTENVPDEPNEPTIFKSIN